MNSNQGGMGMNNMGSGQRGSGLGSMGLGNQQDSGSGFVSHPSFGLAFSFLGFLFSP